MSITAGTRLGPYEVLAPLGAGGMGEVYRARDTTLGRDVALKILSAAVREDQAALARFKREARAVAALNHPHIVTIHGIDESDGLHYIAMELIEGRTLSDVIPSAGMRLHEVLKLAIPLADAIAAAHAQGIAHRDLKPANIMVTREGRLKVLDFGLARLMGEAGEAEITRTQLDPSADGQVVGTVAYMSPEQARGEPIDSRTDLFSLGIILYEMATGRRPFTGATSSDVLASILRDDPAPISAARPDLPRDFSRIVRRALTRDPERRYQTAKDLRNDLQTLQDDISSGALDAPARGQMTIPAELKRRRVFRVAIYSFIGIVVLLLAGYAWDRFWALGPDSGPEALEREPIRSIVVLPFENLMNDPSQDYFVEGMHDALITALSKIKALNVISRTTAMQYAGSGKPLPEIARELNVDGAIEGSVLRAGNVVRVTTQLIDARDRHIWAENFDRELSDILALYNEVTREIATQVQVTISPAEKASLATSRPINPAAYELYLKGRHLCQNWSPQEMRQGAALLQEAIGLATDDAVPRAQLAMCLVDSAFFEYVHPDEIDSRARAAAVDAVRLNDRLAEAHVALGSVHYYLEFDTESAEVEYLRALELNQNSVDTLLRLSWFYAESGRFDEALEPTRRAVKLDPLSTPVRNALGQVYYLSRNFDLAIQHFGEALNLDRSDPSLHYYLGLAYEQKKQYDEAIALFESAADLSGRAPLYLSGLGHVYGQAGMREQSRRVLEEIERSADPSAFSMAVVHLGLGNEARALELLSDAVDAGNFQVLYLKAGPRFDGLRDDPTFANLLSRIGG